MHPKLLSINNFDYPLPNERIAVYPLEQRDLSKLLIYKEGKITTDVYNTIAQYIPDNSLIVFNNTSVIQARLLFEKSTGSIIEIFCLEPYEGIPDYSVVLAKTGSVRFKCLIGGASKWKEKHLEKTLQAADGTVEVKATMVEKLSDAYVVEFSWNPEWLCTADILDMLGDTPLPPYIKRKPEASDKERYQTIFAKYQGSVAAPTAGLHFTPQIFKHFQAQHIQPAYVTLHVGAGTFKPVKANTMEAHEMHSEWIEVNAETIQQLIEYSDQHITVVGTTSMRTIESLYWMGVKAMLQPDISVEAIKIQQWDVYEGDLIHTSIDAKEALHALLNWMKKKKLNTILSATQIMIAPSYNFRLAKALITNFHQPKSTLILLVAAAVGEDWKTIYQYALENNYRFLSYGDGSLLFL
ncbi:MAG: S-adenosylmethionine:tRNA ribosyltransferase-isomerase [Ferruginibacter sp.]